MNIGTLISIREREKKYEKTKRNLYNETLEKEYTVYRNYVNILITLVKNGYYETKMKSKVHGE